MHALPAHQTRSILVLGAGELGMAVIKALADHRDLRVTVALRRTDDTAPSARKKQTVETIDSLGVEIVYVDTKADSVAKLAQLFSGFDMLISCLGFASGAGTQLKLTHAVLQSDLKRYIPWQFGVDYDAIGRGSPQNLFDEQLDVRDVLRGQTRIQWQIVSTGMFTSFLFEPAFGVVDLRNRVVRALGSWDTAVTVTTPEDIGRLTAQIASEPPSENPIIFCAGDTLSYGQLADLVEHLMGSPMRREEWTLATLRADLAANPDDTMRKYRAVFAEGKGVSWDKKRTYNATRGIPVTTVAQWIERHLAPSAAQHGKRGQSGSRRP
ncbi:aromatic alcohol reductase [Pseudomonas matsuisoli]|uniref:2'-hydroxyisoflavone reductase n=1 Tax=Pseudomonas matsuisoli TaxID=1515666 RepID=A0A917PQB6_9PSED|nr:aromatic alcohol reductase [Pseudomonas matsuisoli]GGJ87922.1 2'-hydroxyisoflavone reductase [Pseudomonas matsuisoli]